MAGIRKLIGSVLPRSLKRRIYRKLAADYIDSVRLPVDADRRTILVLNHFFDQDLKAIKLANDRYRLLIVAAPELFRGAKMFFEPEVIALRAPYDQTPESERRAYAEECRWMLERLGKDQSIDLIVATSDTFYWIREFISVARELGIKTIVIDKEGTISPYAYEAVVRWIKEYAPFMSDHIYVWSESQREFWMKTGVEREQITVTGQPRSDLFFVEQPKTVDRYFMKEQPLVTYFIFDDKAYIPREKLDVGLSWKRLKAETMSDLVALSQEFPDYNYVVKAHPQQSDLKQLQEQYGSDNLIVIGGSDIANELILRSELIIGFQTTALIEAMFLDKRVIYTAWDELFEEHLKGDLLQIHEAPGIVVAETRERFNRVAREVLSGEYASFQFDEATLEARRKFVDRYFYKPDGQVCARLFGEFDRLLNAAPVQ